jgi:hypothetical protein
MATKLIQLQDGTFVEVEVPGEEYHQISSKLADRVAAALDNIQPAILKVCQPIANTWKDMGDNVVFEQAEIEFGLSFEGEGNLYITRAKTAANLTVKLTIKPRG